MTDWPINIPLPLAAAAAALYAAWLIWTLVVRQRVLAGRDAVQTERMLMTDAAKAQIAAGKSLPQQIRRSGRHARSDDVHPDSSGLRGVGLRPDHADGSAARDPPGRADRGLGGAAGLARAAPPGARALDRR